MRSWRCNTCLAIFTDAPSRDRHLRSKHGIRSWKKGSTRGNTYYLPGEWPSLYLSDPQLVEGKFAFVLRQDEGKCITCHTNLVHTNLVCSRDCLEKFEGDKL